MLYAMSDKNITHGKRTKKKNLERLAKMVGEGRRYKKVLRDAILRGDIPEQVVYMVKNIEELQGEVRTRKDLKKPSEDIEPEISIDFVPHDYQREILDSTARFITAVAGSRGGKTRVGAFKTVRDALATKDGHFWVAAPTYKMLDVAERDIVAILDKLPPEVVIEHRKKDRLYQFISGSILEFRSAEWEDTLRGAGLNGIWIDEAAFVKRSAAQILRSRVSDKLGWILNTTTPKGKGWVYDWFQRGLSDNFPQYHSVRWSTKDNPYFPAEEWDELKKVLPADVFAQEHEAKFLDDRAGVFRGVDGVVRENALEQVEGPFFIGVDFAKHRDWTVVYAMDSNGDGCEFVRFNELDYKTQVEEVERLSDKWHARGKAVTWIDSTGVGEPLYDDLVSRLGPDRVSGMVFTVESKRKMVQGLQAAIEQGHISIPNERALIDELKWFEYKRLASGSLRYEAPQGLHDDCVWALALANWGRLQGSKYVVPAIVDLMPEGEEDEDSQDGEAKVIQFPRLRSKIWRTSRLWRKFR